MSAGGGQFAHLDVADLTVVASRVLGLDTGATLDLLDLAAAERALAAQAGAPGDAAGTSGGRSDPDPAGAAARLLHALVTERPFRRANQPIALMAVAQLLALNGYKVDLTPPEATAATLAALSAGELGPAELAGWLGPRLHPNDDRDSGKEAQMRWLPKGRWSGGGPFARFTDRARRAIALAQDEARLLDHGYIGTEHILLGLLRIEEGIAAKALTTLGVSLTASRDKVLEIIGRGDHPILTSQVPNTPRANLVLELSVREALQLGHNYIGTEHLLLAILRAGDGLAAKVLTTLDVDHDQLRDQIIRIVDEHPAARAGAPAVLRVYDGKIAEVRQEKETAIDEGDSETAAALNAIEQRLLTDRADQAKRLAAGVDAALLEENRRLKDEVDRLRGVLHQHGIDPEGNASRSA